MNRLPPEFQTSQELPHFSLAGAVIVAAPLLEHELFGRAVCLVVEHTPERAIGILLNRPFALDVAPLWEQLTEGLTNSAPPPSHLNFGGPNSGPVVAIHDSERLAEGRNNNGIYLSAQVESLKQLAIIPPNNYRLMVGHSEWKSGELEQEVRDGKWFPLPASPDLVFGDDYDMWRDGMRKVGGLVVQSILNLPTLPKSPWLN